MLLMVAGTRSWSDHTDSTRSFASVAKDFSKQKAAKSPESNEAKVNTLSLDAVITPAISFAFSHHFHFLPQAVWHFVAGKPVVRFTFQESFFLVSYFHRIFGRFIVTNAP